MEKSISDVIVLKRYSNSKIYSKPIALPLSNLIGSDTSEQNLTKYQASILSIVFAKKTLVKPATTSYRSAWEDCQYSDISSMQCWKMNFVKASNNFIHEIFRLRTLSSFQSCNATETWTRCTILELGYNASTKRRINFIFLKIASMSILSLVKCVSFVQKQDRNMILFTNLYHKNYIARVQL